MRVPPEVAVTDCFITHWPPLGTMPWLAAVTARESAEPLFTFSLHSERSPVSMPADHRIFTVGADVGAGVGAGVGVVTGNGAEGAETLPAVSTAATVKTYDVPATSPLMESDVLLVEPTRES